MEQLIQKFADLHEAEVLDMVRKAIDEGTKPQQIFEACQEAMILVGERFENSVYFVSDLMMSGQIFKEVNTIIKPLFQSGDAAAPAGKVVVGTVAGDIHDIGKDLVVGMLEANNYEVFDLGVDQPVDVFINKVKETGAPVLALSGLLTVAFDSMKETISALEKEGLRDKVKVMIGGGPIDQGVCDFVNADGWGNSANSAVKLCKEWIGA